MRSAYQFLPSSASAAPFFLLAIIIAAPPRAAFLLWLQPRWPLGLLFAPGCPAADVAQQKPDPRSLGCGPGSCLLSGAGWCYRRDVYVSTADSTPRLDWAFLKALGLGGLEPDRRRRRFERIGWLARLASSHSSNLGKRHYQRSRCAERSARRGSLAR